jgi:putative transposase
VRRVGFDNGRSKKKVWKKIVSRSSSKGFPIKTICHSMGYARSSYYKAIHQSSKLKRTHADVLKFVYNIRQEMPNLGCRKLHYLLRRTLLESGHTVLGRDRLFELLRERNMLIHRKRKYAVTTDSKHPFKVYENLILNQSVNKKNQVWVSDITYVRTKQGFSYISLITDMYSRKIVGYLVSNSVELKGCVKAYKMALKNGKPEIHHSDRGSQYCSYVYTDLVKKNGAKISMASAGNCYENALAERINGILKHEFNLCATFENLKHVRKAVKQAVKVYNEKRPNWALNFKMPDEVYFAA